MLCSQDERAPVRLPLFRMTWTSIAVAAFWLSAVVLLTVYFLYPVLLALTARPRAAVTSDDDWPSVTVIISAYNEVAVITEKINNSLALSYPEELLEILVVSDASDDGTDAKVAEFADPRVTLLRMDTQSGKSSGLNQAVAQAKGDLLLLTDANAMFEAPAVRQMARHFADHTVGVVTGQQRYYEASAEDSAPVGEGLYWRYELKLKELESAAASLVGGDGAIMMLRRSLYRALDPSDLSDYLLPLRIVGDGYRNVFEPSAVCWEDSAGSNEQEFGRKVRIVNRAWRATMKVSSLLNPLRHGTFALQIWIHKVLRWCSGLWMLMALGANLVLLDQHPVYLLSAAVQALFYLSVLAGAVLSRSARRMPTVLAIPYYFCLVHVASLKGIWDHYRGETYTTWTTVRATDRH